MTYLAIKVSFRLEDSARSNWLSISLAIGIRAYMQLCSLDTSGMRRARVYVYARAYAYFINFSGVHTGPSYRAASICRFARRHITTRAKIVAKNITRDIFLKKKEKKSRRMRICARSRKVREREKARLHGVTNSRAIPEVRELCAVLCIQDVLEVAHFLCTTGRGQIGNRDLLFPRQWGLLFRAVSES